MSFEQLNFRQQALHEAVTVIKQNGLDKYLLDLFNDHNFVEKLNTQCVEFKDYHNLFMDFIPPGSAIYNHVMDIFKRLYFAKIYPSELVLCKKRYMRHNDIDDEQYLEKDYFIPRAECEFDHRFIQYCVGALLYDDTGVYCLRAVSGNMNGKVTLVQGHISYNYSFIKEFGITDYLRESDIMESAYVKNEIIREIEEETSLKAEDLSDPDSWLTVSISEGDDMKDISYYHKGFVFLIKINRNDVKVTSNEPEKHMVYKFNFKDAFSDNFIEGGNKLPMDEWFSATLNVMKQLMMEPIDNTDSIKVAEETNGSIS